VAEPNNAPWNLKWCGGQMYIHTYADPNNPGVPTPYGRWQGLSNPTTLAPATVNDCGTEPEPSDPVISAANSGPPVTSPGPPSAAVAIDEQTQNAPIDSEESTGRWRPGRL
jgi:hypothetical protein